MHQLDLDTLRSIVQAFLVAYPEAWAVIASNSLVTPVIGLVGRRAAARFDTAALSERLARVTPRERVVAMGFEDDFAVLGSFVAGPSSLKRFAGDAALNTDDRPVVAYSAPRVTYAPDSTPSETLVALLHDLSIEPGELLAAPADPAFSRRLSAYWAARERFVESGREVRPSARVRDMLAQVREPLLGVLRISPDFRPAYDPLLSMATALARSDVEGARALLAELARAQPARVEAAQALASMDPALRP
jgi:spermidine synthase